MWYWFSYGLFNLDFIKQIFVGSEKDSDGVKFYYLIGYDRNDNKIYLDSFETLEEAKAEFEKVGEFLARANGYRVVLEERKAF